MAAALAILVKDLRVFLDSWRAIALVLLLPSVLVLFVGQVRTTPTRFSVLLAVADEDLRAQAAGMASMLGESSAFDVQVLEGPVLDPLQTLRDRQVDLLCVFEKPQGVSAYSGVTDPFRAALLLRAVDDIRTAREKTAEWEENRKSAAETLQSLGAGIERALDVFARTTSPVDFKADEAALRKAVPVWSQLEVFLSSSDEMSARDWAALVGRLLGRVRTTLASTQLPPREATFDEGLRIELDALRAAVEFVQRLQPRSNAARPEIDALKREAQSLGRTIDSVASKLHSNRLIEFGSAGSTVEATFRELSPAFIDAAWYERLRGATTRAKQLMESDRPEATDRQTVAEVLGDGRELARAAKAGEALATESFPTLLNAMVARVREPALTLFYPMVTQRPRALLPETIALVVCFLPFVISVQSLLREREERTIEILLSAPRMSSWALFAGKLGLPMICGLFNFALTLVLVHLVHSLYVKPSVTTMLMVLLPAMLSSTLLGFAASVWVRSAAHATIVCAIYFLVVTLFSGFLYPIASQDPRTVIALSAVSPLTFVHPAMKAWLFGAPIPWLMPFSALVIHCVVAGTIAAFVYRRWLRSI